MEEQIRQGHCAGYFQASATKGNKGTTPAECACAINPGVTRVSFISVFSTSVWSEQIHTQNPGSSKDNSLNQKSAFIETVVIRYDIIVILKWAQPQKELSIGIKKIKSKS